MKPLTRTQLEEMRVDGMSPRIRSDFADAEREIARWEHARGRARSQLGIEDMLAWVDALRAVFGEPEVDRRPWSGSDFRL